MKYVRLKTFPKSWNGEKIRMIFQDFGTIIQVKNIKKTINEKKVKYYRIDFETVTHVNGLFRSLKNMNIIYDTDIEVQSDTPSKVQTKQSPSMKKQNIHTKSPQCQKKELINSIPNPSFFFYKDKAYGKDIENFSLQNNYEKLFSIKNTQTFELTTTYPGLLVGSGYNHPKLKENKDDFQLGFFFDHTTGLPLISGSSIKGALKAVFSHPEFVEDVYHKDVTDKLKYLFEEQKVIFYDAFIVKTANKDKKIFGSDYITSHFSDKPNGEFKEPQPIKFLKILPEVTFRFQFKFLDAKDAIYLDLFKEIIQDFGLGAKTNTGYGKFES